MLSSVMKSMMILRMNFFFQMLVVVVYELESDLPPKA